MARRVATTKKQPIADVVEWASGGTANPEGGRQQTDKAEARRAASAQAAFPSRRAREKAVPEKGIGDNCVD